MKLSKGPLHRPPKRRNGLRGGAGPVSVSGLASPGVAVPRRLAHSGGPCLDEPGTRGIPLSRAVRFRRCAVALALLPVLAPPGALAKRSLSEDILEAKYRRGDYGVYLSWYDPWGAQFDEHGSFALPIGVKVRFRLGGPFRVEADMSYYRKGSDAPPQLAAYDAPGFDGVTVTGSLQAAGGRFGPLRPYAGGGPVFVSLSNDFAADLRACGDVLNADCRRLITWSEVDLGLQVTAGVDILAARHVFPFVEYRHLFGKLDIGDFNDSFLTRKPEELVNPDGTDVSRQYDWSGPNVLAGLRIRF